MTHPCENGIEKNVSSEGAISSGLTPRRARVVFTPSNVCSLHPDNRHPWRKLSKDQKTRLALISWFPQRWVSVCTQSESWHPLQKFHWSSQNRFQGNVQSMRPTYKRGYFPPHKMFVGSHCNHQFVNGNLHSFSATAADIQPISNATEWEEARVFWGAGCSRVAADPP